MTLSMLRDLINRLVEIAAQITAGITTITDAVATRAPSSSALTNATWTDAKAGYLTGPVALAANPQLSPPIATNWSVPAAATSGGTADALAAGCAGTIVSTSSTSYTTVVDIAGAGVLNFLAMVLGGSMAIGYVKLTIDGVVIFDSGTTYSYNASFVFAGSLFANIGFDQIPFETSLKIEHKSSSAVVHKTVYKLRRTA